MLKISPPCLTGFSKTKWITDGDGFQFNLYFHFIAVKTLSMVFT